MFRFSTVEFKHVLSYPVDVWRADAASVSFPSDCQLLPHSHLLRTHKHTNAHFIIISNCVIYRHCHLVNWYYVNYSGLFVLEGFFFFSGAETERK